MTLVETPEVPRLPQMMLGAASPLWPYFAGAALGGMAFWWMTRWSHPANLEALFEAAGGAAAPVQKALEPTTSATLEAALEAPAPVGGESAPVSPVLAAAEPRAIPEPEAAPPAEVAAPEPQAPKLRKVGPSPDA